MKRRVVGRRARPSMESEQHPSGAAADDEAREAKRKAEHRRKRKGAAHARRQQKFKARKDAERASSNADEGTPFDHSCFYAPTSAYETRPGAHEICPSAHETRTLRRRKEE